jgi:uncharacterized membrane protein required for colicin V production
MTDLPLIDMIVLTIVSLAVMRGVWIGLIREGLSLAAIGACTIVTRLFVNPVSIQLTELTGGELTGKTSAWIAGALLVMATIVVGGIIARVLKRGAQFAGLGWADRLGGGALGLAEGAIIAAIIVLISLWLVGPDHPATDGARSVELVEDFKSALADGELPAVAAPGKWF